MATESSDDDSEYYVSSRDPKGRMMMAVHIVQGSFVTAVIGAGGESAMDAAVWSRLQEDLMWRVVQVVPVVKHFQWQLVSRLWRQVLTSHGLVATAAALSGPPGAAGLGRAADVPPAVTAYVIPRASTATEKAKYCGNGNLKVVDIDLSFVPSWFWKSDRYSVLAAMDGLVCISNDHFDHEKKEWSPEDNQYCVINPLTRTWRMLPKVPFAPCAFLRSCRPVVITGVQAHEGRDIHRDNDRMLATCDPEGAGQWTLIDGLVRRRLDALQEDCNYFAVCRGEIFHHSELQLHLINAGEGAPPLSTVTPEGPLFLDLDWLQASSHRLDTEVMHLVSHQGSLFLVAELEQWGPGPAMSCGIWQLVRSQMEWEAIEGLEMEEVRGLIRSKHGDSEHMNLDRHFVGSAWGVGDLLCVSLLLQRFEVRGNGSTIYTDDELWITVGFNIHTGSWELLYDGDQDDARFNRSFMKPFELRPDSFLL